MNRYLPGDVLSRRKGLVLHRGIALGDGRVLHNTPWRGEHVATEAEFSAGHRLSVTRLDRAARERALAHAGRSDWRRYDLFSNNCEHTVTRAIDGRAHSPQLMQWLGGVAAGAALLALTRHPGVAAAGFVAVRAWLARDD
jgi:hypothetical protein